jgi:hypothetical protein
LLEIRRAKMKAKAYLQRISEIDRKINKKQMILKSLYDLLYNITPKPKEINVQSSGPKNNFDDTISKIVDLQNEINKDIDNYVDMKIEAIKLIDKMSNDEYAEILIRRYINYEQWKTIAKDLGYTRQGINKKHGRALFEFQKLYT